MTVDNLGTGGRTPRGRVDTVTPAEVLRASRPLPARTVRDTGAFPPVADGARPIVPAPLAAFLAVAAERSTSLRAENDSLHAKLSRLSHAIQGLASDLAASRRECRRQQLEIDALRAENSTLRQEPRAAA